MKCSHAHSCNVVVRDGNGAAGGMPPREQVGPRQGRCPGEGAGESGFVVWAVSRGIADCGWTIIDPALLPV
ncbi:MAG TPA: hypothetical protein VKI65_19435 [Gemmataceae bacterium]|nr:hypothetical protein [Gemmataceae bacterium]